MTLAAASVRCWGDTEFSLLYVPQKKTKGKGQATLPVHYVLSNKQASSITNTSIVTIHKKYSFDVDLQVANSSHGLHHTKPLDMLGYRIICRVLELRSFSIGFKMWPSAAKSSRSEPSPRPWRGCRHLLCYCICKSHKERPGNSQFSLEASYISTMFINSLLLYYWTILIRLHSLINKYTTDRLFIKIK